MDESDGLENRCASHSRQSMAKSCERSPLNRGAFSCFSDTPIGKARGRVLGGYVQLEGQGPRISNRLLKELPEMRVSPDISRLGSYPCLVSPATALAS